MLVTLKNIIWYWSIVCVRVASARLLNGIFGVPHLLVALGNIELCSGAVVSILSAVFGSVWLERAREGRCTADAQRSRCSTVGTLCAAP